MYGQFGYVVGSLYYAKYLNQLGYHIDIICVDVDKPKIDPPKGVAVTYVSLKGCKNGWKKRKKFIAEAKMQKDKYDIIVIRYFQFCSALVWALRNKHAYIDYRTGLVGAGRIKTLFNNTFNRLEMIFSRKVFILSEDLAKEIKLPKSKYIWLPLGADDLSSGQPKEYVKNLNLFYIGTLSHRNIEDSVVGFAKFYNDYHDKYDTLSYHIVARGSEDEIKILEDTISQNGMDQHVIFHGSMTHAESQELFDLCNCGVAYVPETFYYDHQPSTKIFEYNLSGLVCIATSTSENRKVINEANGVLCHSNAESFHDTLVEVYSRRETFNWDKIKKSQEFYSWSNIVKRVFDQEFQSLK